MRRRRDEFAQEIEASAETVFDLVHDYERRLSWDTLLREAYVEGDREPDVGVVAVCTGRWFVGGLSFRTEYVSFRRGEVAAVKLLNRPPFFEQWAASIRHEPVDASRSRLIYTLSFAARPRIAAWLIEPVLALAFRFETKRRLRALAHVLRKPEESARRTARAGAAAPP
jgi:hypothetical protein